MRQIWEKFEFPFFEWTKKKEIWRPMYQRYRFTNHILGYNFSSFFFWMIEEQFNFRVTSRIEFSLLSIVFHPPIHHCSSTLVSPPWQFLTRTSIVSPPLPKFLCFPRVVTLAWMQIHIFTAGLFAREFSPRKENSSPFIRFQSTFIDLLFSTLRPTFFFFPNVYQSRLLYVLFPFFLLSYQCFFVPFLFFFLYYNFIIRRLHSSIFISIYMDAWISLFFF